MQITVNVLTFFGASNHSKDEDTAEITFKPQASDESNVLEGEGTPAGTEEVQDIKGMSPETLTVYLEYRERLGNFCCVFIFIF
jgi:hypothetical protein